MTSDARARPQEDDAVTGGVVPDETTDTGTDTACRPRADGDEPTTTAPRRRRRAAAAAPRARAATTATAATRDAGGARARRCPLVPVLAVLLVLLLAGVGFLWFTRPGDVGGPHRRLRRGAAGGPVRRRRHDVVRLPDPRRRHRADQAGDHRRPAEGGGRPARQPPQADHRHPGDGEHRGRRGRRHQRRRRQTPPCCWSSSRRRRAARAQQAEVVRYRIRVEMEKEGGRWLLSGHRGDGDRRQWLTPLTTARPTTGPGPTPRPRPGRGRAPHAAAPRRRQPARARGGRRGRRRTARPAATGPARPRAPRRRPAPRGVRAATPRHDAAPAAAAARRARRPWSLVLAVLCVARRGRRRSAALAAAAPRATSTRRSSRRPAAGSQALYAYDYKDSDGSVQRKLDVLTGDLRDQYKKDLGQGGIIDTYKQVSATTSYEVLDVGLQQVNDAQDTATVVVFGEYVVKSVNSGEQAAPAGLGVHGDRRRRPVLHADGAGADHQGGRRLEDQRAHAADHQLTADPAATSRGVAVPRRASRLASWSRTPAVPHARSTARPRDVAPVAPGPPAWTAALEQG